MIRARVIEAAGFGDANIIELLSAHPEAEIVSLVDLQGAGPPISAQHTHLKGLCDLPVSAVCSLYSFGTQSLGFRSPD